MKKKRKSSDRKFIRIRSQFYQKHFRPLNSTFEKHKAHDV